MRDIAFKTLAFERYSRVEKALETPTLHDLGTIGAVKK
jgi:hypothetical protein